jgi:hypothetical protein
VAEKFRHLFFLTSQGGLPWFPVKGASTMFLTSRMKTSSLTFMLPIVILVATSTGQAQSQAGGAGLRIREQVNAIQHADLDRLLLTAVPAKADTEAGRAAIMKQVREDFKDLQALNNKMMAEAWARETLDYSLMSDMASSIRGKAVRLNVNLNLPSIDHVEKAPSDSNVSTSREFRSALLVLDRTIMSFVTNPVFKKPKAIEVSEATRARHDLESVIELTADLKKISSRLAKVSKPK